MRDYEDLVSVQLEAGIQVRIYVGVGALSCRPLLLYCPCRL